MSVVKLIYRFIGNFVWKLSGGVAHSLIWMTFAIIFALTVIGFPMAIKCFRIGYLVWKPFGKGVVNNYLEYPITNTLWACTIGLILTVAAFFSAIISIISLIGIPLAPQWFKVARLSLMPFGAFIR